MKDIPAFPHSRLGSDADGMTLRDYFAAKAMEVILADIECGPEDVPSVAKSAYILADAMLQAREA